VQVSARPNMPPAAECAVQEVAPCNTAEFTHGLRVPNLPRSIRIQDVRTATAADTVRRLARLHTHLPLLAFTPEPPVRSQLALTWGTESFLVPRVETTDAMVRQVDHAMLSISRYQPGDLVAIVGGSHQPLRTPPTSSGYTAWARKTLADTGDPGLAGPLGDSRVCLAGNEWAARMWEPNVGKERFDDQHWEGEAR
jgi:hypothetical protein